MLKDMLLLGLIFFAVSISLPVSTMGYQSSYDYFFSNKDVQVIEVDDDCLISSSSCTILLGQKGEMTVNMPVKVSSTEAFSIVSYFSGKNIDGVSVLFKGIEHGHGLRKLLMLKVSPHEFKVKAQLGYCGSGVMHWVAMFEVHSDQTIYKVSLPFSSIDPKADSKEALEWLDKAA